MKIILSVLVVVTLLMWLKVGGTTARAGYATAPYQVIRTDGKFELRDYPVLVVAETPMNTKDNGFMRLFHFIGGENAAKKKIVMTTPVFISHADSTNATMAFVMPASLGTNGTPQPTKPEVAVKQIPAGRFAVLRFSGWRSEKNSAAALAQLTSWLAQEKIKQTGEPVFAYFDPPWTLPWWRRNEVMFRIAQP
jgi:DNA gyrase inhibitor GyrI